VLDNLPGQAGIGRRSFIQEYRQGNLDARHSIHEPVEDRADNIGPDGQGRILVELDRRALVGVGKCPREISRDDDGHLGRLPVHRVRADSALGSARLHQVCHFIALQHVDDQLAQRARLFAAGHVFGACLKPGPPSSRLAMMTFVAGSCRSPLALLPNMK